MNWKFWKINEELKRNIDGSLSSSFDVKAYKEKVEYENYIRRYVADNIIHKIPFDWNYLEDKEWSFNKGLCSYEQWFSMIDTFEAKYEWEIPNTILMKVFDENKEYDRKMDIIVHPTIDLRIDNEGNLTNKLGLHVLIRNYKLYKKI